MVRNYAAVTADTFSSELGILSRGPPRLITNLSHTVPPGTNGGVTTYGVMAGLGGSCLASATAVALLPTIYHQPKADESSLLAISKSHLLILFTVAGLAGTLLDSVLGSLFQASVTDTRTGKVIEGDGGRKVKVHGSGAASTATDLSTRNESKTRGGSLRREHGQAGSRQVVIGRDVLDNNAVNAVMAATISALTMLYAWLFW